MIFIKAKSGKCSIGAHKPHSTVVTFQSGAARAVQGTETICHAIFRLENAFRQQKRREKRTTFQNGFSAHVGQGLGTTESQHM